MNTVTKNHERTQRLVGTAIFTAIVVILQFISMNLRFATFSITLVLMPIVLGAAFYGIATGAWLGLVFGITVLLTHDADPFLAINIPGTIITVLAKGVLAGIVAASAYKLLEKVNRYAAVIVASVLCPVVNTGVFLLGCRLFFFDTISAGAAAEGQPVLLYLIVFYVGINFIIEFALNIVLDPAIIRIIDWSVKGK